MRRRGATWIRSGTSCCKASFTRAVKTHRVRNMQKLVLTKRIKKPICKSTFGPKKLNEANSGRIRAYSIIYYKSSQELKMRLIYVFLRLNVRK